MRFSLSRKNRGAHSAPATIQPLENRRLLSATVLSQVPTQTVTVGQTATTVNLPTFLNDPALTGGTVVEMQTPLGIIPLQLTDSQTPLTVTNFVAYINNHEYTPTIIQRSAPGFVLQGGGTKPDGTNNAPVQTLTSEAGISNTAGTISMALSTGPNSGTNQWFINLGNNSSVLDGGADGGPFTVFGNVIDGGMTVANAISQLPIINGSAENPNWYIGPNDGLPVINYGGSASPATVPQANLVTDNISMLSAGQAAPTYTAVSANPALVTAQVTNGVLTLTPVSNSISGTTTVTATVTDLTGETATSTFTVNVVGRPTVSIGNASVALISSNQILFPVTLSAASTSATTFNYTLTPGTAPAGDFQALGNAVSIPAGQTQASIPVTILGDQAAGSEAFTITLSNLSSNAVFANSASTEAAIGTIAETFAPTTTTLVAASPSVAFGGSDILVATINPAIAPTPSGSVSFFADGNPIGTASVVGNTATLNAPFGAAGDEFVTAVYSGDGNYAASTSPGISVNVAAPAITPTVGKTTLPTQAVLGTAIHGTTAVVLNNSTQTTEKGTATFSLFAAPDGVIDAAAVPITTLRRGVNLKAGATLSLKLTTTKLPASLTAGTYTLLVQTTDPSGNVTDATTGPTIQVAAPFVSLTASAASIKPTALKLKKSGTLTVTLFNAGNVTTSGSATINIGVSADGQTEAFSLTQFTKAIKVKPNHSLVLHLHLVVPATATAGTYTPFVSITQDGSTATAVGAGTITIG
ncbi:MAG: peptidyl-prolyl cis-trans isomerase (rotamase) - cyclophilin family [Phycisphaerales bacterium]|nr:peptidyl-prolyl cis-trans isomerase (rotamase) - cyclophilin family [Phycisphaerales bacterium]